MFRMHFAEQIIWQTEFEVRSAGLILRLFSPESASESELECSSHRYQASAPAERFVTKPRI
jgi:hypothetical protein